MGVAGLWPLLEPAQSVTTLTALSLTKFDAPSRGFRIGIDASIWFFHAEYGKEGENPELRTLFFRCAQLLRQGFLPLFVFDGSLRPDIKRGKRINKSANKLTTGMQAIIEAFGFEYRTAPGEAEAELAFLNRIGVIDGILSDDVDNFLFGAHTVIRNHSSTHASAKSAIEKAKVITFTLPHPSLPDIDREDLIFIALCSGGDYGTGLDNCGVKISYGLARAGFGKSLCKAATNHSEDSPEFRAFLRQWKASLAQELKTNASGFLPRKSPKLANNIPESFPDIKVLRAYLVPITSESLGRSERYDDLLLNSGGQDGWLKKDPSLSMLAEKCEFYFEWGFMESIIKRFRTVIFEGVALRILRRAIILDSKTNNPDTIPLDTIHSHFSTDYVAGNDDSPCLAFIKDISKVRKHESTSKTLEYRLCINPSVLVQLTACGVKGIRRPDDQDEWAEFENEFAEDGASSEDEGDKKTKKKDYPDPTLPLKLWLPAVLVSEAIPGVVEAYEEVVRRKEEKKAGKGKRTKSTDQTSKVKSPGKPKAKITTSAQDSISAPPRVKPQVEAALSHPHVGPDSSDEDLNYDDRLFNHPVVPRKKHTSDSSTLSPTSLSSVRKAGSTSSPFGPSATLSPAHPNDLKSFFNVSKPSALGKGKQKASIPRPDSLISLIDDISTPKKKKQNRKPIGSESSSPEKVAPRPFPLSTQDSLDEYSDSDDPSDHPVPPITPSPKKKTRKVSDVTSASESESSSRKDKERVLNKSPRKGSHHTSPKNLGIPNGETRKTIRDIRHPSRARAASPTPVRRSPAKSTSMGSVVSAAAKARPTEPSGADPSKTPVFVISDSDSEDGDRDEASAAPPRPPVVLSKQNAKPKSKPRTLPDLNGSRFGIDSMKTPFEDDDDDIPPLLQARARFKGRQGTNSQQLSSKVTVKKVDIIELSD
ncbi:hypothetical protein GYMLUDRAFT_791698 [Collybiopsis luxurians FD-317 M1]|nr:hypothetical protein GYMLUDRAFT_791698 [Collybiopsis luxurians FD-317 M1]